MAATAPGPGSVPGPPHLADQRTITILSTEHWSLLTARSLVYNETFTRGAMFLTLLSASLVALGLLYQPTGGGQEFRMIAIAVLALDLFVGLATVGRVMRASTEEIRALQGMARIRHAYLEMVPTLEPYFSTASNDDVDSTLQVYGAGLADTSALGSVAHGFTTMPGMLAVVVSAVAGALAATVGAAFGAGPVAVVAIGIATGILVMMASTAYFVRTFTASNQLLEARFPPAPRA